MSDPSRLTEHVAEAIRYQLFKRRMSGAELGRRAGMTQPYISRRLTGTATFDLDDLEQLAQVLELEVADLLPKPALRDERGPGAINNRSSRTTHRPRSKRLIEVAHLSRSSDVDQAAHVNSPASGGQTSRALWTHRR